MAQWTMTDEAAGSPNYANAQFNSTKNQSELYLNVTEDDVVTDVKVGLFAADDTEMGVTGGEADGVAHSGWHIRTEGTGNRAGRVHYECLVAGGITTSNALDDTQLADS